ncbi:MAG: fructose-6-phosphate aldolase [Lachnospiraceae bacterium]|nr:fructose-6-phosphate aldolase [Lachnospiraceae bacterium]
MKLLIDDANFEKIKRLYEFYPIDGVTTNPSILAKSGRNPYEVLTQIRDFIGKDADLHVQVISRKAEDMVVEGRKIAERLGKNTLIKIPTVEEGLKAMKALSAEGYRVTATAIYTPQQAFLAGKAGADYAAPYVNRIDNLGGDGVQTTMRIHDIYENNGMKTQLLAASFKNTQQVLELAEYGIGAATVGPDVIEGLMKNVTVDSAVEAFIADFEKLVGTGKTMLDC